MLLLSICFVLLILIYFHIKILTKQSYWKRKSVFDIKPTYLIGNMKDVILRRMSLGDLVGFVYNFNKSVRYIGIYQFCEPILILRDPDLIKEIAIREFDSFTDRTMSISKEADPCWGSAIPFKTAQDGWSETRSKISPSFTPQKLRLLIPLMQESTQNFIDFLKPNKGTVTVEMKEAFSKTSCDLIGNVAFGVLVNSFKDPNNEFYVLGKKSANLSGLRSLIFTGYISFPKLMEFFRIQFFDKDIMQFFQNIINETRAIRKEKNIFRPDFIHLLTTCDDSNKGIQLTDNEITANSLGFILVGLESISTILAFAAYEFALNPEVQNKVYEEVTNVLHSHNGNLTHESVCDIKYLDTVILEILRLHLPNFAFDRKCTKTYVIQPKQPGELPLTVQKGTFVWAPIYALHHDPKYFPNPYKLDPERFNSENKAKIIPNTFVPFGIGPRKCIGDRFTMVLIKVIFIEILKHYEILRTEKTEVPLTLTTDSLFNTPKNGIWLGFKPRTKNDI